MILKQCWDGQILYTEAVLGREGQMLVDYKLSATLLSQVLAHNISDLLHVYIRSHHLHSSSDDKII